MSITSPVSGASLTGRKPGLHLVQVVLLIAQRLLELLHKGVLTCFLRQLNQCFPAGIVGQ